jgi:flagellar biosynthesis GTPase FlhF
MTDKKSFVLYTEYYEQIKKLNPNQKAELLDAIFRYAETGEVIEFSDITAEITFGFIRQQMERNDEKYKERKVRNAKYYENKKNAENNFKTNSENSETEKNFKKNSETEKSFKTNSDSDNDNDNDNVNDNVNENENVNDNDRKSDSASQHSRSKKSAYGKWKNVLLTDDEYRELIQDYGSQAVEVYIIKLDEYIETTGKKYRNHCAVIQKWLEEDKTKDKSKVGSDVAEKYKMFINNI